MAITAACECGLCRVELSRLPTKRLFCHCTICQEVYGQPYADVSITDARTIHPSNTRPITFRKHKKSLALDSGTCMECKRPVLGLFKLFPGVKLAFLPRYTLGKMADEIMPCMHIHYQSRIKDSIDTIPKFEGELRSTIACLGPFVSAFRRR
ncbi:hypothetical protein C1J03_17455 [Sulfitobacter sp. SK012]|uniref:GFA family protein n=1 Tax=Sulfitobacter sp. SK012 TaxID=1389005 RepID=UPI000E0BEB16|nr:hypothetical protein C1J03_17455 [Sulfitobacter sp. SK012]